MGKGVRLSSYVLCAFVVILISLSAYGQDRPQLMVLGVAHLNNPGRDSINFEVEDILSGKRQSEIQSLVEELAAFNPTHIAIEVLSRDQADLDKRYASFLQGTYDLGRSETDQIGIRLAARLGHEQIYAVDWNDNPPGNIETDYNWHRYGLENGFESEIESITDPESAKHYYVELGTQTVKEWMIELNRPQALQASHRSYFDIAMIGTGENLIGANWVGTWYARNLKIFSRLVNMAEKPTDRVLVVYGQAHAYLLQQFAREYDAFELVTVESVLTD